MEPRIDNPLYELLDRTEKELATLAVSGLANTGPATGLEQLAGELATAGLGKLGERLRAVATAVDAPARTAAWATAWAAAGLVRTRLVKPQAVDPGDVLVLPQAPTVVFRRPEVDLASMEGLLAALQDADPLVRAYAAGRLVEFSDEAVPGLLWTQQVCGRCIRFLCIEALGRIGTVAAVEGLVGLLGDKDVARQIEEALLTVGAPAAPALDAVLQDKAKKNQKRRPFAAKILWRLKEAERLGYFRQDDDSLVAGYALAAARPVKILAEQVGQEKSLEWLPAIVAVFEAGRPLLDDVRYILESAARNKVAEAVAVLWHTGAEGPILAHYMEQITTRSRKEERDRAGAIVAHLGSPAMQGTLLSQLSLLAGVNWINLHILHLLGEIGASTATTAILHALEQLPRYQEFQLPGMPSTRRVDIMPVYQRQFAPILGRVGDPAAIPFMLDALVSERDAGTQQEAEKALLAIGGPAAGPVGERLLTTNPAEETLTATLERILAQIGTPEAEAALARYRGGTDNLSRLMSQLTRSKVDKKVWQELDRVGMEAFVPLMQRVAETDNAIQRKNAIVALMRLKDHFSTEQQAQSIELFVRRLQAEATYPGQFIPMGFYRSLVAPVLVEALCELDASSAAADILEGLSFLGANVVLVQQWQQDRRPWLLATIAGGISSPRSCWHALQVALHLPAEPEVIQTLWPALESVMKNSIESHALYAAVQCLQNWGDPHAVPLLRGLINRMATVPADYWKTLLSQYLTQTLAELDKKRSLLDRLRGK